MFSFCFFREEKKGKGTLLIDNSYFLSSTINEVKEWREEPKLTKHFLIDAAVLEAQWLHTKIYDSSDHLSYVMVSRLIQQKFLEWDIPDQLIQAILDLSLKDRYTFRHSIGVAIISYFIGSWLEWDEEELKNLAISGLLHDLGKMRISDSVLNKPGKLTADEYAQIKYHTRFGYEMIQQLSGASEQQALVALQHHERMNGSGYPLGISGDEITTLSKVVMVADVFHTMISERPYKKRIPLYQVIEEIYQCAPMLFDATIVQCLIQNIMERRIGDPVILSDGQMAHIKKVHLDDLMHPLVESYGQFIDLRYSNRFIVSFVL